MTDDRVDFKSQQWIDALIAQGHSPVLNGDGTLNYFAYNPMDPHNGPKCATCNQGWCWHCEPNPNDVVGPCPAQECY